MPETKENPPSLPSRHDLQRAIDLYLQVVYDGGTPGPNAQRYMPLGDWEVREYLGSDQVERTPPDADVQRARSFAIRLGNPVYPNMKLRLSRPPREEVLLFSVDAHDAMLQAPPGSPDFAALEELKQLNADLATRVTDAWEAAGLPTEKSHLRDALNKARAHRDTGASDAPEN